MHLHIRWRIAIALIATAICGGSPQAQTVPETLTLRDALAIALEHSPALEAYSQQVRAAEARTLQAGLLPNPELEFEIEDIRFTDGDDTDTSVFDTSGVLQEGEVESGPDAGLGNAEFTLSLSQLIELGGKRAKRVAAAEQEVAATTWDYEIARVDVLAGVARRFVLALAAQADVALAAESLDLAKDVHEAIAARVEAGGASPIEGSRARLEAGTAETALDQARSNLRAAVATLAAAMGVELDAIGALAGDLEAVPVVRAWRELEQAVEDSPEMRRWLAEIALHESRLTLERARRWPDLTVTAGWRATNLDGGSFRTFDSAGNLTGFGRSSPDADREHSFLVSFSLPIPIFDRNQGAVREAEHLVSKAEAESRAAELRLEGALYEAWQAQTAAAERVTRLREEVVPQAEQIFAATREGYREGKFDYLAVLDTQRTLFESRAQLAQAQADLHIATYELERLAGSIVDDTSPSFKE